MLTKTRHELTFFHKFADIISKNEELQALVVESLITLIKFWSKAHQRFGRGTIERLLNDSWQSLYEFETAMKKLNETVENVKRYALFEAAKAGLLIQGQLHETGLLLATFHLNAENKNIFPADELGIFVLHGHEGSGKTATAQAYAQHFRSCGMYDAIFWKRKTSQGGRLDIAVYISSPKGDHMTRSVLPVMLDGRIPTVLDHFDYEINHVIGGIECANGMSKPAKIMLLPGADLIQTFSTPEVWGIRDVDHILSDFGVSVLERAGTELDSALASLK
ncbi:Nicotinamide/nicotinic acid mononucleotide adenylyltransferase 1 [Conoideocrella luteorostrata]|uniref:Nicotinamide/nicotinic acid mononucleotide adenylyltransferase 1 n=1 Tax=Conoideocrella luteorostrata TaxID=1105319 RepID=A0AAJ0CYR0_9HYPO|nr:Nicotinamide/nicotinic acid mononucleotide adenylyltransferase 1 [Conoideocrella luteorostrata]